MVKKNNLCAALLLFLNMPFHARAEVIGLGDSKKGFEFKKHIQETPGLISLNDRYLKKELKKTEMILKSKYELAVKGLLLEDLKPSKFVFKEITSFPQNTFLNSTSTEIVSQSHMRLAHLDGNNSNFWIKSLIFFSPEYSPQDGLFNPLVSSSLAKQKKQLQPFFFKFEKNKLTNLDTKLFVNGKSTEEAFAFHPSGSYRLTFLREGFHKKELNVSGDDIIKLKKVKLKPLNLGTCQSPRFQKKYGIQIEKIFFSKNCIKSIQDRQSQQLVQNQISNSSSSPVVTDIESEKNAKVSKIRKGLFEKKSTWYAIGAGIAAGVLIASLSNQSGKTTVVPVER